MKNEIGGFILLLALWVLFNNCHNGKSTNTMSNQNITVTGTARNGKDGALIFTENGSVYYVDGLEKWNPTTEGNEISVSGVLSIESISMDEIKNENGEWKW